MPLLESLARQNSDDWVFLAPQGALIDDLPLSGPRWLVVEGQTVSAELLAAAGRLRPQQRLVLPVERRLDDEILPQRWLDPQAMRLGSAEIEETFAGVGAAGVEELARLTDGWIGPLGWLHRHWRRDESPDTALGTARFSARFQQRVVDRFDPGVSGVLLECSLAGELEPNLWRRVWLDRPEKLAALERLVSQWALVLSGPGASLRLPRLLRRAMRDRGLSPASQRELYSQLGLGAHALGFEASAERYLSLAGDASRLRRWQALGGGAGVAAPSAAAPAAAATGSRVSAAGRRTFPRFSLHLLGQPMVRRLDAEGKEDELDWRLRRAFLSLAFLALAPDRRATKEQLLDAIWRDVSETSIAKNFHPTLSEARRTLGHRRVFVYNQGLYTLNPDLDWWIDSERFVELIRQGRKRLAGAGAGAVPPAKSESEAQQALVTWLDAWRLYRGELLAGLEADWIQPRRQALRRDYIELLSGIGDLCARLGQPTRALDAYRSVLLEEPFEERIHLAVMELYARQGRRDLVRRQFVRMQELLLDELNVEPREETRERYHQLMR